MADDKDQSSDVDPVIESLLDSIPESNRSEHDFEEFVDERMLISHDMMGTKQLKIKIVEISDEISPLKWKFGDRVKVDKILVTIKHLDTQTVEEGEFDIASIEQELKEKRHYTSSNRWIPTVDIKNGYVKNDRHTTLISDAVALDYIVF